jgi:hypothetical protein
MIVWRIRVEISFMQHDKGKVQGGEIPFIFPAKNINDPDGGIYAR